jgi:signal transduction histidine kinase
MGSIAAQELPLAHRGLAPDDAARELSGRRGLAELLSRATAEFAAHTAFDDTARELVRLLKQLPGIEGCAVGVIDDSGATIRTVASSTTRGMALSFDNLAPRHARDVREVVDRQAPGVIRDPGRRALAAAPFGAAHQQAGVVVGWFRQQELSELDALVAVQAFAALTCAALEREALLSKLDQQFGQLDAIRRTSMVLTEGADGDGLVAILNDILHDHGVYVIGVTFRDRKLAQHMGGADVTPVERASTSPVELGDGSVVIPLRLGRRVVGSMRVRATDLPCEQLRFLEVLGSGIADVARRRALQAALEQAARDRAVADERERIASDLHDSVEQIFVAQGLLARRHLEELSADSPWAARLRRLAELADQGQWEIERTVRALAFVPTGRRSLPSSLRALARSIEADSGIAIIVEATGAPRQVTAEVERALYRVAHEALTNAWRHARCAVIRLELLFDDAGVLLRIVDDGVGLSARHRYDGVHVGVDGMRRAVGLVGGSLRVRHARSRGVVVEARVSSTAR